MRLTAGASRAILRLGSALAVSIFLAGCATPQLDQLRQSSQGLPEQAEVAGVPFFPQEKYYCGPAALAMALAWTGLPVSQEDVAPQVYTPGREGTLSADIVAAARRNGRLAVPLGDLRDLLGEIAAGNPVLVFQNLGLDWYPVWHYAVAIGYDLADGNIILHSGLQEHRRVSLDVFERTWARADHWALTVLPPDRLPATAGVDSVLAAALGLERARREEDAAVAFQTIADRWPDSFPAWMGLGNARYALSQYAPAAEAYRRAIDADPKAPQAWNNLAYALVRQGEKTDAVKAAETAVALGGEDNEQYRATLTEIGGMN